MATRKPQKGTTEKPEYTITGDEESGYTVYEGDIAILFNIPTRRKAVIATKQFAEAGGIYATIDVPYKGRGVSIRTYGGMYSDVSKIDPEIRDAVFDLNSEGFATAGSCAGHPDLGAEEGFISFVEDYSSSKDTIRRILADHKLSHVRFKTTPRTRTYGRKFTVYFKAVGGYHLGLHRKEVGTPIVSCETISPRRKPKTKTKPKSRRRRRNTGTQILGVR